MLPPAYGRRRFGAHVGRGAGHTVTAARLQRVRLTYFGAIYYLLNTTSDGHGYSSLLTACLGFIQYLIFKMKSACFRKSYCEQIARYHSYDKIWPDTPCIRYVDFVTFTFWLPKFSGCALRKLYGYSFEVVLQWWPIFSPWGNCRELEFSASLHILTTAAHSDSCGRGRRCDIDLLPFYCAIRGIMLQLVRKTLAYLPLKIVIHLWHIHSAKIRDSMHACPPTTSTFYCRRCKFSVYVRQQSVCDGYGFCLSVWS